MQNASHSICDELTYILLFLGAIWAVFFVTRFFPDLAGYGIMPRSAQGLIGILFSPFLHANFHHLCANTVPLFVLLALLAGSRARSWEIVLDIALLGGFLLWLCGRSMSQGQLAVHIGASGLIFGLIAYLIVSGLLEGRLVPLAISLGVGFFYGGTLLTGVLPTVGGNVSWDGHLTSAVAGGLVAYFLARPAKDEVNAKSQ
jgi:membrane associated rhomboid family serine protease